MALTNDYPTIRPSLLLDFARSRALDPRITFTRATIATRVNEDGLVETVESGVPRFDFDPVTLTSKGLLIEEQRTNLYTYSEDISEASWGIVGATISTNAITAPDGTTTADKLVEDLTNTFHYVTKNSPAPTIVSGTTYTISVFIKAAGRNYALMALTTGFPLTSIQINLVNGTVSTGTGTPLNAFCTNYGNGWFRCGFSLAANGTSGQVNIYSSTDGIWANRTYTGDGTSGLFIWGAQLEAGAFPTSYIPTTTTSVQRNADQASMIGANFSSWFNNGEGTFYAQATFTDISASRGVWGVGNPTLAFGAADTMYITFVPGNSGRPTMSVLVSGVSQVGTGLTATGTVFANVPVKMAAAYKVNDYALTFNGVTPGTDTSATVPTPTGFSVGGLTQAWNGGGNYLNSTISKIAYYPVRLTNAQLQALTRS